MAEDYPVKRAEMEIGEIYTPSKDVKHSSPAHWHNFYFIPIEKISRANFNVISISPAGGGEIRSSNTWSNFVKKSLFKKVTTPNIERDLIYFIFKGDA